MALILDVYCVACSYASRATVGSGRPAAGSSFYFPYGCSHCKKVVDVQHVNVGLPRCPVCVSSELISFNTIEFWVAGEGRYIDVAYCADCDADFRLAGHGVAYPCPCCGARSLNFESLMRID